MSDTADSQADETINLDDDSLLSPDTEGLPPESPLERLARLDSMSADLEGIAASDEAATDEVALDDGESASVTKSTEHLDTLTFENLPMAESIDLGSDSMLDMEHSMQTTISSLVSEEPGKLESPDGIGEMITSTMSKESLEEGNQNENSQTTDEKPTISKYFIASSPEEENFFDNIAPPSKSPEVDPKITLTSEDVQADGETKVRTTSLSSGGMSQEEATPVAFEEVKGEGLKFVASTESVRKFFAADTEVDVEGKGFFDSFTAGDGEDTLTVPSSPKLQPAAANGSTQPVSIPSVGVPKTPPVPSPLAGQTSPINSPLHQPHPLAQVGNCSRTTSQSSPVPSPHNTRMSSQGDDIFTTQLSNPGAIVIPDVPAPNSLQEAFQSGEDVFSASLSMSDSDRSNDAWIPTELTRQILVAKVRSAPGMYTLELEQQTMPGILVDDPQGDPVRELVHRFMGEQEANKRVSLTAESVTQDENGLRQLISSECWRAAIDLTGVLLTAAGQGAEGRNKVTKHSPYTLQLWFCRIALLMKLRMYSHAESECQAFGNLDRPDLYYEYYPDVYPGRRGAMVPYAFRLLQAEVPQYLGKAQESLDRLYYVQAITSKIMSNLESGLAEDGSMLQLSEESRKASRELWENRDVRLLYSIGNCLMHIKDYCTAIEVFETLVKKDENNKDALLCGVGRIYLQLGDVKTAQEYFRKVEKQSDENTPKLKCRNLMNKGFVALGQNQFSEAQQFFMQTVQLDPLNAVAVNNMAVCWLYMGHLKDALSTLETLVHSNPVDYLQEGVLFNLCTLYELESSRAMHKKQTLLDLVSKHMGNGFNTACLKMT